MGGGNFQRQVRPQPGAVQNDRGGRHVAGCRQIGERPFSILAPAPLAGVRKFALAIAAIIERQNVHAHRMQRRQRVDRIAQVPVLPMQIENRVAPIARAVRRRNPPAPEPRLASLSRGEAHRVERHAHARWRPRNRRRRMVKQLPTALPEQQAQREPCARRRRHNSHPERGQHPPPAYRRLRLRRNRPGWQCSTRHGSGSVLDDRRE